MANGRSCSAMGPAIVIGGYGRDFIDVEANDGCTSLVVIDLGVSSVSDVVNRIGRAGIIVLVVTSKFRFKEIS